MNRRDFLKTLAIVTPVKRTKRVIKKSAKNTLNAAKTYENIVKTVNKNGLKKYSRKEFLDNSKLKGIELSIRNRFNMFSEKQNFLSDASFNTPLPDVSNWAKRISNVGNSGVGKLFFKDAQHITRKIPGQINPKISYGIAQSGKSLRTAPFLIAGGLGAAYGGYRAKKTYDKYKPEIETGRKLMRKYNQFKNMFNKEGN
jgi:hypothetical protein